MSSINGKWPGVPSPLPTTKVVTVDNGSPADSWCSNRGLAPQWYMHDRFSGRKWYDLPLAMVEEYEAERLVRGGYWDKNQFRSPASSGGSL